MARIANADIESDLEDRAALLDSDLRIGQRLIDNGLSGRRSQREQRRSRKSERQKPAMNGLNHHHPPPIARCTPVRRVKMVLCVLSV